MLALLDHRPLRLSDFLADGETRPIATPGVGVHVVSLEKCALVLGALHDLLDPWEQEFARSIANRGRRTAHIASRALIRLALSEYSGKMVRPDAWSFMTNPYGKLTLARASRRRLSFSISYANALLAIAVSESPQLSIDLEPIPDWTYADVTWDALSERETLTLLTRPVVDRYGLFLRHWTLKEAATKCLGVGVGVDFRELDVTLAPLSVRFRGVDVALRLDQHEIEIAGHRHLIALAQRP